jgi:hypothetical protein
MIIFYYIFTLPKIQSKFQILAKYKSGGCLDILFFDVLEIIWHYTHTVDRLSK